MIRRGKKIEGFLHKEGFYNRAWRRRYFCLENGVLRYYHCRDFSPERQEKGVIDLKLLEYEESVGRCFKLRPSGTSIRASMKRTYHFMAESAADKAAWATVLSRSHLSTSCRSTTACTPIVSPAPSASPETLRIGLKAIECPICLECWGTDDSHPPTTLPCGHSLCIKHIPHINNMCPVCRAPLPENFDAKPSYAIITMASQMMHLCSVLEGGSQREMPSEAASCNSVTTDSPTHNEEDFHSSSNRATTSSSVRDESVDEPLTRAHIDGESQPHRAQRYPMTSSPTTLRALTTPRIVHTRLSPRTTSVSSRPCGHYCQLSLDGCCQCTDRRPPAEHYDQYVDGRGWQLTATRHQFYCPECRLRLGRS